MSLLPSALWAQDPYCRQIDASDGLPSNEVYGLFQDSKGFIWITTDDGLCRYDGHTFKSYASTAQSSRAGANIFEDPLGRIWYENFDGRLYHVSGDTLVALPQKQVNGFVRAGHLGGSLYVPSGPEQLDVYDLRTLRLTKHLDLGAGGPSAMLGRMGQTRYWVFGDGAHRAIDAQGQVASIPGHMPDGTRLNTVTDHLGRTLIFDNVHPEHGLHHWEAGRFHRFADLSPTFVQVHEVIGGRLWICHTRGMEVFDVQNLRRVGSGSYFADKSISAVLVDREGNHWFGTTNEGLLFVPDFNSRRIPSGAGGLSRLAASQGTLLAGTHEGAILRFDDASARFEVQLRNQSGHAIDFLGADGGTLMYGDPLVYFTSLDGRSPDAPSLAVFKDALRVSPRYLAVAGPANAGLFRNPLPGDAGTDVWDAIATVPNAIEARSYDFFPGRTRAVTARPGDTTLFFATSNGLMRLRPHSRVEIRHRGRPVYASKLQADARHLYALSTAGELLMITGDSLVTPIDDLPLGAPYAHMKLLDGKLYLLGRRQMLQLGLDGPRPRLLNIISSLQGDQVNDIALHQGQLALATDDGLILLDPDQRNAIQPPRLLITDLRILGRSHPFDTLVEVGYQENEVAIHYAILSYRTNGDYPLYYRIQGGSWSKTDPDSRQLLLAGLAPGQYDIAFCLGAPSQDIAAVVRLHILRPFWMQTWFYLLGLLLLAAFVAAILWRRGRRMRARQAITLEKIALENSLRISTLAAIRSQMNPHFFFNALNTIQAFIFSDDKANAINYLGKFSKLTRMVLEMSEKELVTLSEEMMATTLYLQLEKSRFGDDFQFQIVVGPGLSPDNVYLPSMIIQPFVENAVKHGLLHKTGSKEIRVNFAAEGDTLLIEVEDNGIGRKRSEELNRIRQERHRSFAVTASQKRIDLLNAGHNRIGVAYTDKVDAHGLACGTHVRITIPLNRHTQHTTL